MDTSRHDALTRDAELLERYAVEGISALRHPDVAASVAAHRDVVREIDAGLGVLREQIAPDAVSVVAPVAVAVAQVNVAPNDVVPPRTSVRPRRAGLRASPLRLFTPAHLAAAAFGACLIVAAAVGLRHVIVPAARTFRVFATTTGQHADISLADGTRVRLAPRSQLRVPSDFGRGTRTIMLVGEAYFDVTHTTSSPFIVRTGRVTTRVLGTTFDVRSYPEDARVRVAVVSGKVVSQGRQTLLTLMAGTVGDITDSVATSTAVNDMESYVGWTADRLIFRETPIPEMLQTLSRWYGVEFRLTDSTLLSRHITVTLDHKNQTDVVAVLESLLNVTTTFEPTSSANPIITLHPRRVTHDQKRRERRDVLSTPMEVGR